MARTGVCRHELWVHCWRSTQGMDRQQLPPHEDMVRGLQHAGPVRIRLVASCPVAASVRSGPIGECLLSLPFGVRGPTGTLMTSRRC